MHLETPRLLLAPPHPVADIAELWAVFNSNPDFLMASEGTRWYLQSDVQNYVQIETRRKHGRCLVVRLRDDGQIVGTAALQVPHPSGTPWIGLLIVHGSHQGRGYGREAALALEDALRREGWAEVRLSVLQANPRALKFWRRTGYDVVEEKMDALSRPCWVLGKQLCSAAA